MMECGSSVGQFESAKRRALNGCQVAQLEVALMLVRGQGVSQDCAEAAKWLRKAAEQGNVEAQGALGLLYRKGEGVYMDHTEAAKWYRAAAEQGDNDAQLNLADMLERGEGVPRDLCEARKWYGIASAKADFGAANCSTDICGRPVVQCDDNRSIHCEQVLKRRSDDGKVAQAVDTSTRPFVGSVQKGNDQPSKPGSTAGEFNASDDEGSSGFRYVYVVVLVLLWILLFVLPFDETNVGLGWFCLMVSPLVALAWTLILGGLGGIFSGKSLKTPRRRNVIMR